MRTRPDLIAGIVRRALTLPDRAAHALVLRDLNSWLRVQFLGVASRAGIARALLDPGTLVEIAERAHLEDAELLEAFLRLGVALGEVRERGGRYAVKGRRLRAIAGDSDDLRGFIEELVTYDAPIHTNLGGHLRGEPGRDYLAGLGDVAARASRIAEPVLASVVRAAVAASHPRTVLDVGCGTGVYLRHVLEVADDVEVVGLDLDESAVRVARQNMEESGVRGRWAIDRGDIMAAPTGLTGPFDLVLLLQNIYYWSPDERPDVLRRLRGLAPEGTVIIATATPSGPPFNFNLDVALRVTEGCWRLPTPSELTGDLDDAGFADVEILEPLPASGLLVAIAST